MSHPGPPPGQEPLPARGGEPATGETPAVRPSAAGPVRMLALAAAGLALVYYLLGFFGTLAGGTGFTGVLVIGGGLLAGVGTLPRVGRVLAPAAVAIVVGTLGLLQLVVAGGTSGLLMGSLVVAFLESVAAVGALLLDAGVVSAPAPRPKAAPAYGQQPYGQQWGQGQQPPWGPQGGYGQYGPPPGYGQAGQPGEFGPPPGQPGQSAQPGQQPGYGQAPYGQPPYGQQPGFGAPPASGPPASAPPPSYSQPGQTGPLPTGGPWGQPAAEGSTGAHAARPGWPAGSTARPLSGDPDSTQTVRPDRKDDPEPGETTRVISPGDRPSSS